MLSPRVLLLVGGAIVLAASALAIFQSDTPNSTYGVAMPENVINHRTNVSWRGKDDEIRSLRRDLTLLRTEVNSLQHQLKQVIASVQSVTSAPAYLAEDGRLNDFSYRAVESDFEELELDEVTLVLEAERRAYERIQLIETSLQQEHVDASWSTEASDAIEQTFDSEELAGASLVDLECRSTLCRVEVLHDDSEQLTEFQLLFPNKIGHILPQLTLDHVEEGDSSTSTVIYLARDGYRLPRVELVQ